MTGTLRGRLAIVCSALFALAAPAFARDIFSRAYAWVDRIDAEAAGEYEGRKPTVVVLLTSAAALTFIRFADTHAAFRSVSGMSRLSSVSS